MLGRGACHFRDGGASSRGTESTQRYPAPWPATTFLDMGQEVIFGDRSAQGRPQGGGADGHPAVDPIQRLASHSFRRLLAALLLVTVVSAGLRLTSPRHGLPCDPEPDLYTLRQVETLREKGLLDRGLAGWKYPLLFSTITAALPWENVDPPLEAPLEQHLDAASTAHVWTRYVTAIIATLAALLTVLLALRFVGLGAATLAGLLMATSGMHVWMSVQARPHAPATTMVLFALLACLRWTDRRRPLDAIFSGIAVGLAGAALHSGLSAMLPWAVAALIVLHRDKLRALPWIGISLAIALAFVVWAYGLEPHEPHDWHMREQQQIEKSHLENTHMAFGGHLLLWKAFNGRGFLALGEGLRSLDPVLGALGVIGGLLLLVRLGSRSVRSRVDGRALLLTLALFAPLIGVFGIYELSYWRFFLPALPAFALLGAGGLAFAANALGLSRTQRLVGAALVLALPLAVSGKIAALVASPTSHRMLTDSTIEELREPGSSALLLNVRPLPAWTPLDVLEEEVKTSRNRWIAYQGRRMNEWSGAKHKPLHARSVAATSRLQVLRAPRPSEAAARYLSKTEADVMALSTCWPLPTDDTFRTPELKAWRAALEAEGWVRKHVIAPKQSGKNEGVMPKLMIPSLFSRVALGLSYEVWARP